MSSEPQTTSQWKRWLPPLTRLVAAYVIATVMGGLAILVVTQDLETVPAGLSVPLVVLPSIALFVLLDAIRPERGWKHVGFVLPAFAVLVYLGAVIWSEGVDVSAGLEWADVSGSLGLIIALTYLPAALLSYGFLAWIGKRGSTN